MKNSSNAQNMIKEIIKTFKDFSVEKDPANNCLDVAIITDPKLRTTKTIKKLKNIAGRVLKKNNEKIFILFSVYFIFVSLIYLVDLILSNSILNYKSCMKYEKFYYELKKNCRGKYRFKKSFPIVETITDEMGLRVGKKVFLKIKTKRIFLFLETLYLWSWNRIREDFCWFNRKKYENYNVYNFGVGSYSPSVYLYKLKKILKEDLIPEKILLFLDLTDLIDEATRWQYDDKNEEIRLTTSYVYETSQKKKNL